MKGYLKIIGIIALLAIIGFSMTACGRTGGTFEIVNNTGGFVLATAASPEVSKADLLQNGQRLTLVLVNDGTVTWTWVTGLNVQSGTSEVSGGRRVTITAR